ncbi:hypothetical protein M0Q50_06490 [bacterium]|jgi:hypothetical protein|nr:hypothetical protein [bacterium]
MNKKEKLSNYLSLSDKLEECIDFFIFNTKLDDDQKHDLFIILQKTFLAGYNRTNQYDKDYSTTKTI